jgi:hypothetical protein
MLIAERPREQLNLSGFEGVSNCKMGGARESGMDANRMERHVIDALHEMEVNVG